MMDRVASVAQWDSLFAQTQQSQKKWWHDFRCQQFKKFSQQGLPTRKNELWKYTEIKKNNFPKQVGVACSLHNKPKAMLQAITQLTPIVLVFINGYFSAADSQLDALPEKIKCISIKEALTQQADFLQPYLLREFDNMRYPFATLNSALMMDGMFLEIPDNLQLAQPIYLLFMHTQQHDFFTSPRTIIVAGQHSQATLIEDHYGDAAERYFTAPVTEIHAAKNAQLTYYKVQDESLSATHVANMFVEQQKDSCVKMYFFSRGSQLAREDLNIWQRAEGATSHAYGLYTLTEDNQHVDHHVHVDHMATHGSSVMLFKGMLDKKSQAVFNGKVYVHAGATHIQAHQENHNLLLSSTAEVNTKPELEIYADDVKCTHGATIGQLDQESLFYLRSRGIELDDAQVMLTHAFAEEMYQTIEGTIMKQYFQRRMSSHYE